MTHELRVILIGGSSHVGKSTLAQELADRLGWAYRATDQLARHPGRPWQTPPNSVPAHVATHYLSLSTEELVADVIRHYTDNVWPLVEKMVTAHVIDPVRECLIMEGSALLPELVVTLQLDQVATIWLTADDELLARRIYRTSAYATKSTRERRMVDKFLERTQRFNQRIMRDVDRYGLNSINVQDTSSAQ